MKLFRKLKNGFSRLPRKTVAIIAGMSLLVAVPAAITVAEFYPNRTPFDYNKPCNPTDSNIYDRCGSLTGPIFNSFINTPSYGDERAFVDARRTDQTTGDVYKNVLPNVTQGSKEVVIRMYVHNNANQSTNASGLGVAKNTKVRVALPTATAQALRARGYISADNVIAPSNKIVEDTVDLTAPEAFSVQYVPGSAKLYDNDNFKAGVKLSDSIVGSGALIGSDKLDGNFKGCFEYEAVVELKVKVVTKPSPSVDFKKQVALPGAAAWGEHVTTKPGDTVKWIVGFTNKGGADMTHVTISDKLPPHLQLVPGTVRYVDAAQQVVQNDGPFFTTGGIDFGTWKPNGGFYVRFDTVTLDDFDKCEVSLRNIAYNDSDQTSKVEDSADVTIKKPNCVEVTPAYSCDLLELKKLGGRKVEVTLAKFTAINGATFKDVTYDFGDGKKLLTDKLVVEHEYAKDGNYVVRATVRFNMNGQVVSDSGDACAKPISFNKEVPEELPSTGPASLAGIFTSVTAAGAVAHRFILGRRRD